MEFIFLGCGDEHGVPRAGCDCTICENALSQASRNYRTCASAAIRFGPSYAERVILVDAAPEFRLQATSLKIDQFDAVLLTHAHDGHIMGLSILAEAQRRASHPLAVLAPDQVLENVQERFRLLWNDKTYRRVWQPRVVDKPLNLWNMQISPLRVNHGIGGTAYGYLFAHDGLRVAYISDMLRASPEIRQTLQGLDLLILGARHYYEGIEEWKRSVMDVMSALELIRSVKPQKAILTHLSHTIDYDEVSSRLPEGVELAYDGLTVEVGP